MAACVWAMAAAATGFWLGGLLWPGGLPAVIAAAGHATVATFVALHIPAAIAGVLLLHWRRRAMPRLTRVMLEAATLYFGLAVILGMFLNFLLVSVMQDVIAPVMRGSGG
jgi:peptidoglycan/LPS O-acetylase OafA/YrhL